MVESIVEDLSFDSEFQPNPLIRSGEQLDSVETHLQRKPPPPSHEPLIELQTET